MLNSLRGNKLAGLFHVVGFLRILSLSTSKRKRGMFAVALDFEIFIAPVLGQHTVPAPHRLTFS